MSKTFAYLEQCKDMHAQISAGEFTFDPKPKSGEGSGFSFRSYGHALLASAEVVYIGEKQPNEGPRSANRRVRQDLVRSSILADRCPELLPKLPRFIGWHYDREGTAILTEDASAGGKHEVWGVDAEEGTLEILIAGFGRENLAFRDINNSMTFETEGVERFLDMTPGPFLNYKRILDQYNGLAETAFDLADDLRFDF